MAFNFKTATPDTSIDTNAFMFGADSQSATNPSIYSMTTVKTFIWNAPTLVTPSLGVATGTSLARGGATLGTNALAVTGTSLLSGNITFTTPSTTTAEYHYWNNGSVNVAAIGGYSDSATAGHLEFYTTTGSVLTERMRIDNSGNVGIGAAASAGRTLEVTSNITGSATGIGIRSAGQIQSDVTSQVRYFTTSSSTANVTFTVPTLIHYYATQGTFGGSSSVTAQYGFHAESTLTGATNNYGFYSNIATAAGRWNFYAAGTASNYMAGSLYIGTTTAGASKLVVNDSSIQVNTAKTPASASDTGTTGQICWDSNYVYVCVATNTWKRSAIASW